MVHADESGGPVLFEQFVSTGVLVGEDRAAVVDQTAVADVLEELVEVLFARWEGVEGGADLWGVGSAPVRVQRQEDDGDEGIAKHGTILACEDGGMDATRVDKWLWAVRLYKTRSAATEGCAAGHVKVNGAPAKAAHPVRVGDRVEAYVHGRQRILEVVQVIEKRVSAPLAAEALVDHSPPPPEKEWYLDFARDPGAGRPTKKDRRALDRLRKPE